MNNNGLISRQTAIDKLFEYAESKFQSGEIELANGILKAKCFLESPCNIPTAYNVDKVLEQLEYSRVPNTGIAGYHKVIEIVKGGGIDGR
ncbi:hypothetical protein [Eubacterium sp.]|jgi:hypothetical protein|uniref:hypothetical protein n=1 Tax=Eubacterium sp. TaxID=142586 RepID=UPI0020615006|nr:MAG TPA: hypothetical protein [Caudoviricetes sp.]